VHESFSERFASVGFTGLSGYQGADGRVQVAVIGRSSKLALFWRSQPAPHHNNNTSGDYRLIEMVEVQDII
jgi:hypothetical protein